MSSQHLITRIECGNFQREALQDTEMNFDKIYDDYAVGVYRFLYALTHDESLAEEFTQECFFRAFRNIEKYDGSCKLFVWLCQIAKNCYYDYCRKVKPVPLDENMEAPNEIQNMLCQKETAIHIHKILHTIGEPYREVFSLKIFGELSYKDISALFGKSENWSRVVFFRAKSKILQKL